MKRANTLAGPHLYLLGFGPGAPDLRVRSAALHGPGGGSALRAVDNTHPRARMMPPSAILIPPKPLAAGGYCATVRGSLRGVGRFTHRWAFVTEGSDARPPAGCTPPPAPELRLLSVKRAGAQLRVVVAVNARSRGRLAVTLDTGAGPRRLPATGRARRRGGSRVQAFRGTVPRLPPGARWVILEAHYRRSDGGMDARTGRTLRARG